MTALRLNVVLLLVVIATAVAVVTAKHESRKRFVQLQALQQTQADMDIEWGKLQLEQSALATHGKVERVAREKLNMHLPKADEVVIVTP